MRYNVDIYYGRISLGEIGINADNEDEARSMAEEVIGRNLTMDVTPDTHREGI